MWIQREIILKARSKGFYLITDEILSYIPEIEDIKIGLFNIHLKHTSASLTLNENADPDVRSDMKKYFDDIVPENKKYFEHTS
jgi:secondary thiamine-phosphate synthase enzyme